MGTSWRDRGRQQHGYDSHGHAAILTVTESQRKSKIVTTRAAFVHVLEEFVIVEECEEDDDDAAAARRAACTEDTFRV